MRLCAMTGSDQELNMSEEIQLKKTSKAVLSGERLYLLEPISL